MLKTLRVKILQYDKINLLFFIFVTFFTCTKKVTKKYINFLFQRKFNQRKILTAYFTKTQTVSP